MSSGRALLAGLGLAVAALAAASLSPVELRSTGAGQPTAGEAPSTDRGTNRLDSYLLDDPIGGSGLGPTRSTDAQRAAAEAAGSEEPADPLNTRSRFRVVS